MRSGERVKLIILEKVVDTHSEKLGDDADMITMVKSLDQVDAFPASQSVSHKTGIGDGGRSCHTYCLLAGSRSLRSLRTRISMFEASRYFGMARIIFTATFRWLERCVALTTFPNEPWPMRRTMRSGMREGVSEGGQPHRWGLTSTANDIVRGDHIVSLLVVACRGSFGDCRRDCGLAKKK